jgi:hypothetical protein
MFEVTLFVHSWFRWVVLGIALLLTFRFTKAWLCKEEWSGSEYSYVTGFLHAYATQVFFGLTLYIGLSPIPKSVIADASLLKNPYYMFFAIRHGLSMLSGFLIFIIGVTISKKKSKESKYKILSLTMIITLLIILSAIPWPALPYGRDLFRWF